MFRSAGVPLQLKPIFVILATVAVMLLLPNSSTAQKLRDAGAPTEVVSAFNEFKGVRLGMSADEARKKLGSPANKSDEQDLFTFGDKVTAQVLYRTSKVVTISIDFMTPNDAPKAVDVVGSEIETKPDGSMHKMVRYPKAGYWVSYSRTAGDSPMVSVTLQKIDEQQ
ncbi:MAG: hypothetical protein QOE77_2199 [Blastocatellia bacterium]|jgi:hypothetical protein|nr:hypothetical protein [Blastocatellia bacterium]